jgi:hypothetical protein
MAKGNWYPSQQQLKDPVSLERSMRRVLQQVYDIHDKVNAMNVPAKPEKPPANAVSIINGLPVLPFDPTTLADGTKLTWVAKNRRFEFK